MSTLRLDNKYYNVYVIASLNLSQALTPYDVMHIGKLPLVSYHRPGDPALAATSHALLLAPHGLIVSGRNLADAVANAEEREATARIFRLRQHRPCRMLSQAMIAEREDAFPRNL